MEMLSPSDGYCKEEMLFHVKCQQPVAIKLSSQCLAYGQRLSDWEKLLYQHRSLTFRKHSFFLGITEVS